MMYITEAIALLKNIGERGATPLEREALAMGIQAIKSAMKDDNVEAK